MAPDGKPLTMIHFMSRDPAAPLRFVPPETPPPFEAKSLVLKQLDTEHLEPAAQRVMSLFSSARDNWDRNHQRWIEEGRAHAPDYEVRTDERANRRFAGDGYLSSTRYFSVCRDADGYDGGTMERELTAYHNPIGQGILDVHDLSNEPWEPDRPAAFLLLVPPVTATRHEWLQESARQWAPTAIFLPVRITEVSFSRLIDLRVPHVADWFTRNLTRLHWLDGEDAATPAFRSKPPLDRFLELLPSLLVQDLGGGNGATRIAGQWLRSLGAEALVFPSARSNCRVEVRDGNVVDSYGWNLVDYRDAMPARFQSFDLTETWPRSVLEEIDQPACPFYADVELVAVDQHGREGSWAVQKLEETRGSRRMLDGALSLYQWAWGDASADRSQELRDVLCITQPATFLGSQAGDFIRALEGDEPARGAFLDWALQSLAPDVARRIDFQGTFQRMDARVASKGTPDLLTSSPPIKRDSSH